MTQESNRKAQESDRQAQGRKLWSEYRLVIILLLMAAVLTVSTKGLFLQKSNIVNLFNQNAMLGIIAIGQFLVILTGGIDLSVGSVMMMCSVAYVLFQDIGVVPSMAMSVLLGAAFGLINAVLTTRLKINSFITTLGTMTIAEGLGYIFVDGHTVFNIKKEFLLLGKMKIASISIYVYFWIFAAIVIIAILKYTSFGVKLYSTGGNASASRLSGIHTDRIIGSSYIISGLLCGIVGILYTSRLSVGDPSVSGTFNTDSITAVVIGGTSMAGGEGSLFNVCLGVLILGMLSNFMNTIGVPSALHVGLKGCILIATVLLNIYQGKNSK